MQDNLVNTETAGLYMNGRGTAEGERVMYVMPGGTAFRKRTVSEGVFEHLTLFRPKCG